MPPNKTDYKEEELIKLLVDAVLDYAIFALDLKGNILTWNKGAERLKGYTAKEILGQHFSIFYTESDIKKNHPAFELEEATKNGRYEEQGWRVKKDGSKFWANLVLTSLRDASGKHIGFSRVTRDLTESRAVELSKKIEDERFRLIVESVKDYAIFMLTPTGHIATWNEGAKRFKGYEAHEIIGQHFSQFYPLVDKKAQKPQMELEVAKAVGRFEDEGWRVRKDGTLFWANVVITALHDKDGGLVGFSKVTRDLTERKKAEEALKLAYEGLEQKIKDKTHQLENALKSREEFLSIASHELKTPITTIKMQLQMLNHKLRSAELKNLDQAKITSSLNLAESQVNRLVGLIDDLLDVSRIQSGKLDYVFEKVNLSELLSDVLSGLENQFTAKKSEVKTFVDKDLAGIWDRNRLEQVFVNLLSNALKYAPGSDVFIFAKEDGGNALISVQDLGPGIAEDQKSKIFERFERLGQSRNVAGLGLGLFIAKQIVSSHGGAIGLKPGELKGTTFVISLPLDSAKQNGVVKNGVVKT